MSTKNRYVGSVGVPDHLSLAVCSTTENLNRKLPNYQQNGVHILYNIHKNSIYLVFYEFGEGLLLKRVSGTGLRDYFD